MVSFLLEHAMVLEEKLDVSHHDDAMAATSPSLHFERGRVTQSIIVDAQNSESGAWERGRGD